MLYAHRCTFGANTLPLRNFWGNNSRKMLILSDEHFSTTCSACAEREVCFARQEAEHLTSLCGIAAKLHGVSRFTCPAWASFTFRPIKSDKAERLSAQTFVKRNTADFVAKLQIALKEASETGYWLELLYRTDYISEQEYNKLDSACTSIRFMLTSSINTVKNKQ